MPACRLLTAKTSSNDVKANSNSAVPKENSGIGVALGSFVGAVVAGV
jgi:hypothetical protein